MKLSEIFADVKTENVISEDIDINGMQYDSRKVKPGNLFFCLTGFLKDGHEFAASAVENGAAALVVERLLDISVPQVVVKNSRRIMAVAACNFYGHPAKKMKMIGITGTNGKTTTTYMIKSIVEKAGYKVGLIGTIQNMIGDKIIHTEKTTPESIELQNLLSEMYKDHCDYVVMEVSSSSLVFDRSYGIEYDVGIFSNLTRDHMDVHGTFENYIAAKALLFAQSKVSVLNEDDDCFGIMKDSATGRVLSYSVNNKSDIKAYNIRLNSSSVEYDVVCSGDKSEIKVSIPGMFSVYNSLAAYSACFAAGIKNKYIKEGLSELGGVPGRFESLSTHNGSIMILDYSHTPDSLENALNTVKGFAKGRIICVFGCGGNRDKTKRPIMAKISVGLADLSVITTDNPRFEIPSDILDDIVSGIENKDESRYVVIEDRREAIKYALEVSREGDVILLAGKGHETYQEIKGVKYDFDEKKVVSEIVGELKKGN